MPVKFPYSNNWYSVFFPFACVRCILGLRDEKGFLCTAKGVLLLCWLIGLSTFFTEMLTKALPKCY